MRHQHEPTVFRFILDNPDTVRGKRVLDVGSGCGASAVAAIFAGATEVCANDIDTGRSPDYALPINCTFVFGVQLSARSGPESQSFAIRAFSNVCIVHYQHGLLCC